MLRLSRVAGPETAEALVALAIPSSSRKDGAWCGFGARALEGFEMTSLYRVRRGKAFLQTLP